MLYRAKQATNCIDIVMYIITDTDRIILLSLLLCLSFLTIFPVQAKSENKTAITEDFATLSEWNPQKFEDIEKETTYSTIEHNTDNYLRARSNSSASALVHSRKFNVYEYPVINWRWKVENIYKNGNARTKKGDDYPLRIYVIFAFNSTEAGFVQTLKYKALKGIYGEYPPHSSLNYIWANQNYEQKVLTNKFTSKAKMIPLQMGKKQVGKWKLEKRHIVQDYIKAFGQKPPSGARIAIMNDSDNTGESAVSYLDYIRVQSDK